jgi:hypothetical protein
MQETFPQGLKPDASKAVKSELKLRPPKGKDSLRKLFSLISSLSPPATAFM